MKLSHKQWYTLAFLGVLVLTNPSIKAFKDYKGYSTYRGLYRKYNFLVGSIYETKENKFVGIAANFIDITPKKVPEYTPTSEDSIRAADEAVNNDIILPLPPPKRKL